MKRLAVAEGRLTPEIEADYERAKIEARSSHWRGPRERRGEKSHNWKGDDASPHAKYMRAWRAKKSDSLKEGV